MNCIALRMLIAATFLLAPPALVAAPAAQADAPQLGVSRVKMRDVAPETDFVGRVEAINAVDILSRVEGVLQTRHFREGDIVSKRQELFTIEKDAYEIALTEAQASLLSAQAARLDAERQLQRNQSLVGRQTISTAALEQSETALDGARANVKSAEARVRQAELNLSYTTISSPLDGRIGMSAFSEGSLVTPSSGTLARVVQTDPIRVVFSVSDRTILDLQVKAGGLSREELAQRFTTSLRLSNGQIYQQRGTIEFFNNEIDPQTGTLAIRVLIANPRSLLVPGQFVTVVVREEKPKLRALVPFGAVQQDREGKFVFVVDDSDMVAMRRIRVSGQRDGHWIVEEGLNEGERLIVEGLQNAEPGAAVSATEAADPLAADMDAPASSGAAQ
ncbi:efflux RND transporter periplasmic adaptor subunit [Ancylobacter sp. 6x-1]|uniref:Efflux RND transporter periplasmic adaptor subunit n=1 Tax=Ancylobacter crimeensis TaxID=2579147 RepID=A0ABT0D5T5_9HYPH|nr:efflux RND transporter periplasmic adaptor subunit [Ancylobacter crimeensis]MCK0195305.1 efflux RND transporter periplasmic adaptor subunit [Ancylobacter crimeensis]